MECILKFNPCEESLMFINKFDSFESAWKSCPRGDWMLWIAKKLGVDKKILFKAKALCAKTVVHLMKDERSVIAVNKVLEYSYGLISGEELSSYADAAYAAAYAAADAAYAAADAAYAAADAAADAADAAAYAAYAAAADAADAAAYAAYAAADAADAAADARILNQKQTADICREILTSEVLKLIEQ